MSSAASDVKSDTVKYLSTVVGLLCTCLKNPLGCRASRHTCICTKSNGKCRHDSKYHESVCGCDGNLECKSVSSSCKCTCKEYFMGERSYPCCRARIMDLRISYEVWRENRYICECICRLTRATKDGILTGAAFCHSKGNNDCECICNTDHHSYCKYSEGSSEGSRYIEHDPLKSHEHCRCGREGICRAGIHKNCICRTEGPAVCKVQTNQYEQFLHDCICLQYPSQCRRIKSQQHKSLCVVYGHNCGKKCMAVDPITLKSRYARTMSCGKTYRSTSAKYQCDTNPVIYMFLAKLKLHEAGIVDIIQQMVDSDEQIFRPQRTLMGASSIEDDDSDSEEYGDSDSD